MDGMITEQRKCVARAEQVVEAARLKLQEVMQERKMHEKLKEKALEQFLYEENAAEFKAVDELTSYTYGQRGKEE
jgi:flagellar FliJ protein